MIRTPIFILTGAGLSVPSGVPAFRSPGGLWLEYNVREVATAEAVRTDPQKVLDFHVKLYEQIAECSPNPAHWALAELQKALGYGKILSPDTDDAVDGPLCTIVTQNIDGLLSAVGATAIEMHGNLLLRCTENANHPKIDIEYNSRYCSSCGAILRPNSVLFGESVMGLQEIYNALYLSRTFISIGTSNAVSPACDFVDIAYERGLNIIEVNINPSTTVANRYLTESAEIAVPKLVKEILANRFPNTSPWEIGI